MRVVKLVAVRDGVAEQYLPPFTARTVGEAIRLFTDEVNRSGSQIGGHPDDYALFHLGDVDMVNGDVEALPQPMRLVSAVDVRAVK